MLCQLDKSSPSKQLPPESTTVWLAAAPEEVALELEGGRQHAVLGRPQLLAQVHRARHLKGLHAGHHRVSRGGLGKLSDPFLISR